MASRVLVAMSGGVDSSVAALLLKEQGYEIIGAHMKLWDYVDVGGDIHKDGRCCSLDSITDCRFVCDKIDAPFYVLNMSREFSENVIDNFVAEYRSGRTPNPCVRCNADVRWNSFLEKASQLGCSHIATGHYAFVERNQSGRWQLRKGVDATRDQSYVLWGLTQEALARTLMPLGGIPKTEVRRIAGEHGLRTAAKPESREICFVADDDYRRFLTEHEEKRGRSFEPGEIVHVNGQVIGTHSGIAFYTIGQRKGLGVSWESPLYVQRIEPETNRVVVGPDDALLTRKLTARNMNWVSMSFPGSDFEADVKIRYLHHPSRARIEPIDTSTIRVHFHTPQRAVTPGQSVVLYEGDIVLGGGIIQ